MIAKTANRASPLPSTTATRRTVILIPAIAMSSSRQQGTRAIVPPTFAPNCGQPQAITAKSATADAAASARLRAPARSSVWPAQATAMMPQTAYRPIPSPPIP